MGIYLNDASGLNGLFDRLTSQVDAANANNATNAALAANGVIPQSYAPPQGFLARLLGLSGNLPPGAMNPAGAAPSPVQAPSVGTPPPPAQPMAYAAPSSPPPITVPRAPQQQQPSAQGAPSFASPNLPTMAAGLGAPTGVSSNAQQALAFYQNKGLSPLAASALVGGFTAESGKGLNPGAVNPGDGQDGSTSGGIGQWNGARGVALRQFAASNGLDPRNIQTQLEFSWAELNGSEKGTLDALKAAQNPLQATAAAIGYERPAGWSAANPAGAGTFGKRLNATLALSQGAAMPAGMRASAYGGVDPNAFGGAPSSATPQLAQSFMPPSPAATAFGTPQGTRAVMLAQQQAQAAQPSQGDAQAYAPTAAPAPAQQAISDAAGQPYGSVPLHIGNKILTRQQAEDTDGYDHTDYDAAALKAGLLTSPGSAPAFNDGEAPSGLVSPIAAQHPQTQPSMASAPPSPAPPASARTVNGLTLQQIQGLIASPSTREMGMQLWGQYYQRPALTKAQAGDIFIDGSGNVVTSIPDKPNFQRFTGKDGSEYSFDPRTTATSKLADGGPGTTTLQQSDYARYGVDPAYKGPVQLDSDGNLKFPAPAGAGVRPELVEVPLADGTAQKQFIIPGQTQGVPVGAPYSPSKNAGIMGPTEQKIFNDHYDKVEALGQGLQALRDARSLSDQTPTGLAATGERAANYATLGHAFADNVANADTYDAKIKLASTALMRAAIGGRVTNYDEKIAQDIAPTSAKSVTARNKILDDQISQKERDYANAQATVEAMRNGSYFAKGPRAAPITTGQQSPAIPAVGAVQKGYRFLGGDPSQPSSWTPAQ